MSLNLDKSRWAKIPFGDVIDSITDRVDDPSTAGVDRYVGLEHLDPGVMTVQRWDSPDKVEAQKLRFQPGDVIFGRRRAYQKKVARAEFEGICSAHALVLRARPGKMAPDFLPVFLSSDYFLDRAIAISVGSLSPTVNWRDLRVQEFDLPPLDEQQRIAHLLWAGEQERRAIGEVSQSLEQVRSVTRDELFRTVDAPRVLFESLCSIPSQNGVTLKKSERAGTVPMVNMGEMFRGEVIDTTSDYERVVHPGDHFLLGAGDLLFARRSIVFEGAGACCLVPDLSEPHTFESSVIRSRVSVEAADPHYVLHFFRSESGRNVMSQIVRRGPVSGIAGSELRTLNLPVPDLVSQQSMVREIDRASAVSPLLARRAEAASLLKRDLLNLIFGGR
ncbi:restriction endonuclease subunit S [Micropruina glycogenica]|uniref:Type I restriction modification DNA specificity domain protein n=1 Tax=Micropruina glycogenica TaxID=75385 RepID=A0A2N9JJM7_9ACTN|nr:restriction endonuclease subunit S [Micropruina glycogenica]SPD87782.1 Type I restriction modification DNA specificity domain protein [Micropruina glycogenica]